MYRILLDHTKDVLWGIAYFFDVVLRLPITPVPHPRLSADKIANQSSISAPKLRSSIQKRIALQTRLRRRTQHFCVWKFSQTSCLSSLVEKLNHLPQTTDYNLLFKAACCDASESELDLNYEIYEIIAKKLGSHCTLRYRARHRAQENLLEVTLDHPWRKTLTHRRGKLLGFYVGLSTALSNFRSRYLKSGYRVHDNMNRIADCDLHIVRKSFHRSHVWAALVKTLLLAKENIMIAESSVSAETLANQSSISIPKFRPWVRRTRFAHQLTMSTTSHKSCLSNHDKNFELMHDRFCKFWLRLSAEAIANQSSTSVARFKSSAPRVYVELHIVYKSWQR